MIKRRLCTTVPQTDVRLTSSSAGGRIGCLCPRYSICSVIRAQVEAPRTLQADGFKDHVISAATRMTASWIGLMLLQRSD
jgi:hypothetical protein